MKFLVMSNDGEGVPLAKRLLDEGNEVQLYLKSKEDGKVLDGIVPKVNNIIQAAANKPDIVFFPGNGLANEYKFFEKNGFKVFGGSPLHEKLENDRFWAAKFVNAWGVRVPKTVEFHKDEINKAKKFLLSTKDRYVVKYDDSDTFTSYVGEDNKDIIIFLDEIKPEGDFILQKFVEGIGEIDTEVWFSNGDPIYQYNGGMEQKKFLAGNMGIHTGCESYLVWGYKNNNVEAVERTFGNGLFDILKKIKYTGIFNINTIISKADGYPYFLEIAARPGYSAIYAMIEIMNGEFGKLISDVVNNQKPKIDLKDEIAFAVTISIPPYPYDVEELQMHGEKVRLENLSIEDMNHIWLYDVYFIEDKGWFTAGTFGLLLYITSSDKDWKQARLKVKKIIDKLKITNIQYRIDAGIQGQEYDKLKEMRYI